MVTRRGRGRPPGESDSRARIAAAAVHEFGEHGYDGATVRAIAARAGVDAALVHHYYGSKADLFAEITDFPVRPDLEVPRILRGPRDEAGERIVRFVLEAFERPEVRTTSSARWDRPSSGISSTDPSARRISASSRPHRPGRNECRWIRPGAASIATWTEGWEPPSHIRHDRARAAAIASRPALHRADARRPQPS